MVEKLDMKSKDITQENIAKIQQLFPNAVTEVLKDGKPTLAVDFDVLKQEMSSTLIDDKQERYQFTWPDKKKSILLANAPISATLRPCKEESVNFDSTQNLYIEGDNLDVLKLLRETYLNKVKMIYIDPPYNTGNDFVYNDDFAESYEEYLENSGQYDEQGNRIVANTESNGRFHTDWLNMIYPRLKVAKDLLTEDGVIFISIDDNEITNLLKICDEVFGNSNWKATFCWRKTHTQTNIGDFARVKEYILCYTKNITTVKFNKIALTNLEEYRYVDENGEKFRRINLIDSTRGRYEYTITNPKGNPVSGKWMKPKEEIEKMIMNGDVYWAGETPYGKNYLYLMKEKGQIANDFLGIEYGTNQRSTMHLDKMMDNLRVFDFSKPIELIKHFSVLASNKDSIILDFFSGSATTAHAVMQLNAEDGGNRKFIMVQLPEVCDEKSEAYKAGYKNICEIGKERIRRAGKQIKNTKVATLMQKANSPVVAESFIDYRGRKIERRTFGININTNDKNLENLDTGFRVLKLDSSNMQNVYYNPNNITQNFLDETIDNIKPDRTPMDLLFQVMLDLGIELSAKITQKQVNGKTIYLVNDNDIIACFDDNIDNDVIISIAKEQPLYAIFKDKSFATDSVGINNEQLFKTYSPSTKIKVL